jgi:hypothetical protein
MAKSLLEGVAKIVWMRQKQISTRLKAPSVGCIFDFTAKTHRRAAESAEFYSAYSAVK